MADREEHRKEMLEHYRKNSLRINERRRALYQEEKRGERRRYEQRLADAQARHIANRDVRIAQQRAWYHKNKEFVSAERKQFRKDNPGLGHAFQVRYKYGITVTEYQMLLESQGGVCAICRNPETKRDSRTGRIRNLAVDHDHETNAVRGLLCGLCNCAIGYFDDNRERMKDAIAYLDKHRQVKLALVTSEA